MQLLLLLSQALAQETHCESATHQCLEPGSWALHCHSRAPHCPPLSERGGDPMHTSKTERRERAPLQLLQAYICFWITLTHWDKMCFVWASLSP